jgi:hypothetical protein
MIPSEIIDKDLKILNDFINTPFVCGEQAQISLNRVRESIKESRRAADALCGICGKKAALVCTTCAENILPIARR